MNDLTMDEATAAPMPKNCAAGPRQLDPTGWWTSA